MTYITCLACFRFNIIFAEETISTETKFDIFIERYDAFTILLYTITLRQTRNNTAKR